MMLSAVIGRFSSFSTSHWIEEEIRKHMNAKGGFPTVF
jgi:hypothetical protein